MRKIAFLLLTLTLVATGCSAQIATSIPAQPTAAPTIAAKKTGKVRYIHLLNLDLRYVPTLMAMEALRAQGYEVETIAFTSSALMAEALGRGDADIATTNPQTMWTAIQKGVNARTFMQGIGSPGFVISKQEIANCSQLDGKRIGLAAKTGLYPTMLEQYSKQNCPNSKPQILVIPESAARITALLAGELDAATLLFEESLEVERRAPGKFNRLVDFGKEFPLVQTSTLSLRRDWADKNPELVKDFIRALVTTHRLVNANSQLLTDEAVKRLGLDPAAAKELGAASIKIGMWDPNGGLSRESIQYTLDFMTSIQAVPAGLKADDVADLTYLNAVLQEIGRK